MNGTKERIMWIDVYKALAICLMVIGHATGLYNIYIYQFHLAAFFCMSGYMARQRNEDFLEVLLKKVYTILLPLIFCVLIHTGFMALMHSFGMYSFWFGDCQYIGAHNILIRFFLFGSLYTWWLGAAWFLIVLFFVVLLSKGLFFFAKQKQTMYFIYSLLVYCVGYFYINNIGINLPYYFDLVLIAQFFYCIGYLIKEKFNFYLEKWDWKTLLALLLTTIYFICFFGKFPNVIIDYGARTFDNIFFNTLTSINGILFLYVTSRLVEKWNNRLVLQLFSLIGNNTLGIVLFHFAFFKGAYLILYYLNKIPYEDIACITPRYEIGVHYWWLISGISIIMSLIVWCFLKKTPLKVFLGSDKDYCYKIIKIIKVWKNKCNKCMSMKK